MSEWRKQPEFNRNSFDAVLSQIEEHLKSIDEKLTTYTQQQDKIKHDIKELQKWQWKTVGASSVLGAVIGFCAEKLFGK
jgi:chromosome condensin MukBEF complex kleisin-like MukF subunit